jgi:hypothetical protein
MKTIKLIFTAFFSILFCMAFAQPDGPPPEKRQQIEAMKIAFITRKLDLTAAEAQVFWPVYNQYQDELEKLRDNHRKEMRGAREGFESMSDKDAEKLVDGEIIFRQTEVDILKKYHVQFKKTIPNKKVAKLYRAEEDFKRELIKRIQDHKDGGHRKP